MKILSISLGILLFLSSCRGNIPQIKPDAQTERIQQLEQENAALKLTVDKLREDNSLLQAGGDPATLSTSLGEVDPSGAIFVEGNFESCMGEAYETYVAQGTRYCIQGGYSTGEILADKCKLENSIAEQLKTTKSKMEIECKNLYQ